MSSLSRRHGKRPTRPQTVRNNDHLPYAQLFLTVLRIIPILAVTSQGTDHHPTSRGSDIPLTYQADQ